MTTTEALDFLEKYNKWRRNDDDEIYIEMPSPKLLGIAIDTVLLHFKYEVTLN